MIIYSSILTHRLRYTADFISMQLTGEPALISQNQQEYIASDRLRLNYSDQRITPDELWIRPQGLLFENGIRQQDMVCTDWQGQLIFFPTAGDWPFDLFSAVFFLLSRYEEYLPHEKDSYGRYAYENSLASREGFLNRPLVNEWLQALKGMLRNKFPGHSFQEHTFRFQPTYDIDEAYAFKYKEWWRSAGGAIKDLLRGRFARFNQRRRVLNGLETDPYDAFTWMDDLHRPLKLKPRYFFLMAGRNKGYDKHILPTQPALQTLVRQLATHYDIGLHPSWQSGDETALLQKEKETLEQISSLKITASRQHYIRFSLPHTFRLLLEAGIRDDYSMGYGSINGFRASVASSFYWYDLEKEQTTPLLLHPFCWMEANAHFEQKLSPPEALDELYQYYQQIKKVNGTMISIWHNTFLGTDSLYEGWREVYAQFVKESAG